MSRETMGRRLLDILQLLGFIFVVLPLAFILVIVGSPFIIYNAFKDKPRDDS